MLVKHIECISNVYVKNLNREPTTDLLDVLDGDLVVAKLLVDEGQGVEVTHPAIEQLIRETAGPRAHYHRLMELQQPGGKGEHSGTSDLLWHLTDELFGLHSKSTSSLYHIGSGGPVAIL